MRFVIVGALAVLSGCGPSSPQASASLKFPKDAVHLDPTPPDAGTGGDGRVLVRRVTAATVVEQEGGVVTIGAAYDEWFLDLMCDADGCIHFWNTRSASACFEVKKSSARLSTGPTCPTPKPTPTTVPFDVRSPAVEPLRTFADVPDAGAVRVDLDGGVALDAATALVDYIVLGKTITALVTAAGPEQLLPNPDGDGVVAHVRTTGEGADQHRYWSDRPGSVMELTANAHRLLAREVRGPLPGFDSDTHAVLETSDHVLTISTVPSDVTTPRPVVELVLLSTPPLKRTPAPLRAFAPVWARSPTSTSAVACFNQRLDPAPLSLASFSASSGLVLSGATLLPQGQCVALATGPRDRATDYRLTVRDVTALSGDRLEGSWELTLPPPVVLDTKGSP